MPKVEEKKNSVISNPKDANNENQQNEVLPSESQIDALIYPTATPAGPPESP